MSEQPIQENTEQQAPLHLIPAVLSLFCPGLGQLTQGRFGAFGGHFVLFVLSIGPLALLLYLLWSLIPKLNTNSGIMLLFLCITSVLPVLLAFFSTLDAAIWKAGEPSRLKKHIRILAVCVIWFQIFIFLLCLPAISSSHEARRRMQCASSLKQIGYALHNYHEVYGSLPPAYTVDESGKPLHSWRTLLLPFLDMAPLYQEIRLDEPWNSEYNRQFHTNNVSVFRCYSGGVCDLLEREFPGMLDKKGLCFYSVVIGDETPFPGATSTCFSDISDGTSNTVFVVERLIPVCWMDPNHEISFDTALDGINRNAYGVGSAHNKGASVLVGDGSVRFISETIEPDRWKATLTKAAGDDSGL